MGITDDEVQQLCAAPSRSASVASLASSSWRLAFEVKALPPNERTGSPSAEALIAFAGPEQQTASCLSALHGSSLAAERCDQRCPLLGRRQHVLLCLTGIQTSAGACEPRE
jgi:hypothetical protein